MQAISFSKSKCKRHQLEQYPKDQDTKGAIYPLFRRHQLEQYPKDQDTKGAIYPLFRRHQLEQYPKDQDTKGQFANRRGENPKAKRYSHAVLRTARPLRCPKDNTVLNSSVYHQPRKKKKGVKDRECKTYRNKRPRSVYKNTEVL